MIYAICHQIPSASEVMRALGIFYAWQQWLQDLTARIVCAII